MLELPDWPEMNRNSNRPAKVRRPRQNFRKSQSAARRSVTTALTPVQFESNIRTHHRYRFVATAGATVSITDTALLGAAGTMCTTVNAFVQSFFQSVRIKRVDVWSAPSAQGANSTCSVEWFGFGNSPNIENSDTSLSVAKNAHVSCKPPANSLAAFWQKATGTNLFTLTFGTNAIVDVILDLIQSDEETVPTAIVVATGVVGHVYYLALDNATGHNLVPVSLNTTF